MIVEVGLTSQRSSVCSLQELENKIHYGDIDIEEMKTAEQERAEQFSAGRDRIKREQIRKQQSFTELSRTETDAVHTAHHYMCTNC